jgi:tRNA(Phe) wybutosine-synthesizing methylase Tyw3
MDRLKADVLQKLDDAVSQHLVDEDVVPLLFSFNRIGPAVTTSSCSGRYQLISVPTAGDKVGSQVVEKWHRTVEPREIMEAIDRWSGEGELHLLVQPLLLHVRTKDISTAARIRALGQEAGMKFSTIRSVKLDKNGEPSKWGIVVELLGTERMEIPIDGIPMDILSVCMGPWIEKGNDLIRRTKTRILRLMELVERDFPPGQESY